MMWNVDIYIYIYYWVNLQIAAVERNDVKWRLYFSENPITSQYIYWLYYGFLGNLQIAAFLAKSRLFLDKSRLWNDTVWHDFLGLSLIFVSILDYSRENSWHPKPSIETSRYPMKVLEIIEIHFGALQNPAPQQSGRAYRFFQHASGPIFPFAMRLQRHQDACGHTGKAWWKIDPTLIDGSVDKKISKGDSRPITHTQGTDCGTEFPHHPHSDVKSHSF